MEDRKAENRTRVSEGGRGGVMCRKRGSIEGREVRKRIKDRKTEKGKQERGKIERERNKH